MRILGIDPGYDRLGWAVIEKKGVSIVFIDAGLIQTEKKDALPQRLSQIFTGVTDIIEKYHPDDASVEELFFSNNQKTVIAVAQSRGVVIACLAAHAVSIHEYTPMQIKSIASGDGHADKKSVEKMMRLQLSGIPSGLIDDTLDAVAAAYAYAVDKSYG